MRSKDRTWKAMKEAIEAAGIKDADEISWIDLHPGERIIIGDKDKWGAKSISGSY